MRELRNLEVEERATVARPAPAHAAPAQASLQDAEGQNLEMLAVRAGFLPGRQRLRSSFANEHSQGARWLILSSGHGSPSPPNAAVSSRERANASARSVRLRSYASYHTSWACCMQTITLL